MTTYGVTDLGFVRPRLVDIQTQIFGLLSTTFGTQINQLDQSVVSQLVGTFSAELDLVWQAGEDAYNSSYPDLAFGVSLDNAAGITGAVRQGPLPSLAQGQLLFGTPGTLIPAGSQVSVVGTPTNVFSTNFNVTLIAGQNCVQTLTLSAVPTAGGYQLALNAELTSVIPFNATGLQMQNALQALTFGAGITVVKNSSVLYTVTFAGAAGLQEQPALVVENDTLSNISGTVTIAVTVTVPGINQGSVDMTATETGPLLAPAGKLTNIVTPINGWTGTINKLDAIVGRNVETDNEFKQRRRQELQLSGAATINAIRSHLLQISGVTAALVFENVTFITDLFGRPPKSIEAVVVGGNTQTILNELFDVKPGGILTFGNTCGNVTDSQGQVHNVCFSRPNQVLIYIELTLTINPSFPVTGVASAQQLLTTFGNSLGIGKEVVVSPYLISALATIPGIEDAVLLIGTAPGPTLPNNIPIAEDQVAAFDTSRINVTTI